MNGLTAYDYGFRIYNPGIGKFLSVDPLTSEFPWYTPYQFAGNTPVQAIDLDGGEPWYMEDRGFSIKWYYQTFNPKTREGKKHSQIDVILIVANNKYTYDAVERLKIFAADNHEQYLLHRNFKVENETTRNSKKLGFFDCVTAQESALQIITGNYDIRLFTSNKNPKLNGSASLSGEKWEKEGIVGPKFEAKLIGFQKSVGDKVELKDYKLGNVARSLRSIAGSDKVGTTFFTFEMGVDFHGGIVGVTLEYNISGTLNATYFVSDQLVGYRSFDTEEGFNEFLETAIFKNTSTEKAGSTERFYDPGTYTTKDKRKIENIGRGNEQIAFRQVN